MRPGRRRLDRLGQRVGGVLEVAGRVAVVVGPALGAAGGPLDVVDAELVGRRLGDAGGQLVGLVDDDRVVVGDHRHVLDRVDREEGVVGDDQVAALRLLARELGEALRAERALGGAEALAVVDRRPAATRGRCGAARCRARRCRPARTPPRPTPAARGPSRPSSPVGYVDERALVVGDAGADAVQAGVVGAALEHGVGRVEAGHVLDRLDQPREVALDELVLQGEGRGGDHHPLVVEHRGTR